MAIFISYSHEDKPQAQTLARNLIQARKNVWIDEWEINAGDSLIERVEDALGSADAILILLSENSVQSAWCQKELRSGLLRELERKSTLVIPVRLDDCEVPLFLREKRWIDLRKSSTLNSEFEFLLRSLETVTNPAQKRIEKPDFHTDWSMVHINANGLEGVEWSFVEHSEKLPFVVLTQVIFVPQGKAQRVFADFDLDDDKFKFAAKLMNAVLSEEGEISVPLDGARPVSLQKHLKGPQGEALVQIMVRRMGNDTGMVTLVHVDDVLRTATAHTMGALREGDDE